MTTRDEFNVSGKISETQKIDLEEKARARNVDKIKDRASRVKAESMMDDRDHRLKDLKKQTEKNIKDAVDEALRKNAALKHELHIKPPPGFVQDTPKQQEIKIENRIRTVYGKQLDDGIKAFRNTENKKIDDHISKSLEKERGKSKSSTPNTEQAREKDPASVDRSTKKAEASKDNEKKGNEAEPKQRRDRRRQRER